MTGMELALLWAKTLNENTSLKELCVSTFGRDLTIGVGYDLVREFGASDAPYVYMHPVTDEGGPQAERREYAIAMYLGIVADKKDLNMDGINVNMSMLTMDTLFAPAVLAVLATLDTPPLQGEGTLWPAEKGFCEKHLMLEYSEYQSITVKDGWA